jgi:hypothetical protein
VLLLNVALKPLKRLNPLSVRSGLSANVSLFPGDQLRELRLREWPRPALVITVLLRAVPWRFSVPATRLMSVW